MYGLASRIQVWLENRRVQIPIIIAFCLIGIFLRVVWVVLGDKLPPTNSEMYFVARTFAVTGQLADAYRPGSGLTAHVAPLMPLFAGAMYRLFGVETAGAEIALMVAAMGFVGLSIFAIDAAMRRLSSPAPARLAALAFVCIAPMNFSNELQAFRVWEGAVAAAAIAIILAEVLRLDGQIAKPSWASLSCLSLAAGLLALASPPAALASYGCIGLLALRRRGVGSFLAAAGLSAVLLVMVSYPWAVRNEALFGEKVWSRTNFGFNFALGFHDAAIAPDKPRQVFLNRLAEVDPYTSDAAYEAMKAAGGELDYSRKWSQRTGRWVAENPAAAVRIGARHMVEYYFPPAWNWSIYSDKAKVVLPRLAIIWGVTILAFTGLAWRLAARDWKYLYVLAAVVLPALPYILAQPILRYRYVVTTLLVYIAADFAWRLFASTIARSQTSSNLGDPSLGTGR